MKHLVARIFILCIVICIVASPVVCVSSEGIDEKQNLFAPNLVQNYLIWCDLFGVYTLDDNIDSKPDSGKNRTTLYIDNLCVATDLDTFLAIEGMLFYKYPGFSDIEMDLRAMGLFAAIEYGPLTEESGDEIMQVRSEAIIILNKLKQAIQDNREAIDAGHIVPFYVGNQVVYSIFQSDNGMQAICFE